MHPRFFARTDPGRAAMRMVGGDEVVTFGALESAANRGAHLFRALGLKRGDCFALLMDNNLRFLEVCWAAQRSGLYFTCISTRLTTDEAAYIVNDCGAGVLIVSPGAGETAVSLVRDRDRLIPAIKTVFSVEGVIDGAVVWETTLARQSPSPIPDESTGAAMLYSSGTTGRPKGVRAPLPDGPLDAPQPYTQRVAGIYGFGPATIYLSPAPLYHAAPLGYSMMVQRCGGEVVIMPHFDAQAALAAIETHRVTHGQWVPTMFIRMLKLPSEVRDTYNVTSLKAAIHAAAPCPVLVKKAMIDWWGPVLFEYYAGTEGNGVCLITPEEWLRKPGSVGRAILGVPHVMSDDGVELPSGEQGVIYFEGGFDFSYHNDPDKTAAARYPGRPGWSTLGDIGYLDDEGYLFLTDRKAFMIVSGGVNIYPQEIENLLISHPKVADVAVIGVPDEEFGEQVKAVVEPADWSDVGEELAAELIEFCRDRLSSIKRPRSVDFEQELPRAPTGKLYKNVLRDRYWEGRSSKLV